MFLITTAYQKAEDESDWVVRAVSSDILGDKETVVEANRDEIIRNIRVTVDQSAMR